MGTNTISSGVLDSISTDNKFAAEPKSNELGQDVFLQLMVAQMENQNPLDPQSNSEFVAQLAQFSSVEGLEKLNGNVESLLTSFQSNQAIQASSLVGRTVTVATDYASLVEGGEIGGTFSVPYETSQVTLNIYRATGELISTDDLGGMPAGKTEFSWDGLDDSGEALDSGSYYFEVIADYDGEVLALSTEMEANVDSVTVGANGTMTLNVNGVGPVLLSSVTSIL